MGLDNGIMVKRIDDKEIVLPRFARAWYNETLLSKEVEICYWRKCHGIRDSIVTLLRAEKMVMDIMNYNLMILNIL